MVGDDVGFAVTVPNAVGLGFVEKVYALEAVRAMAQKSRHAVRQQRVAAIVHDSTAVDGFFADPRVAASLRAGLKTMKASGDAHLTQCANHIEAADARLNLCERYPK